MKPEPKPPASRVRRVARWLFKAFLGLFALLLGLIAIAIACINLPPVRAFVASKTTALLAGTFKGKLVIERIGSVGWSGVNDVDAHALDPAGKRVITVRGLSAHLPWPRLVWDLVVAKPNPQTIEIHDVSFEHAEVALRDDGSGTPTLADTFASPTPSTGPSGTQTNVVISSIAFCHAWVHGALGSAPPIDADLAELRAKLRLDDAATFAAVDHLRLAARGLPQRIDPRGELRARVRLTKDEAKRELFARFRGEVASVPLTAQARLSGQSLDAVVQGVAEPAAVSRLAPGVSPRGPIELFAKATGNLPELALEARLESEGGHVDASGRLRATEPMTAELELRAAELDASAFVRDAPLTELSFELGASAEKHGQRLSARYDLTLEPSLVSGQALPATSTRGTIVSQGESTRIEGSLDVREAGAPTHVAYTLDLGRASLLEVQSSTALDDPARLKALAGVSVSGTLRVDARIELEQRRIAAHADARLARVRRQQDSVGSLRLLASANGSLNEPALAADLWLRELSVQGRRFERARVSTRGTQSEQSIEAALEGRAGERIEAASIVKLTPEVAIEKARLAITREQTTLRARAEGVTFAKGVAVRELVLDGVGHAELSLTMGKELEKLELATRDLDIPRLAFVLGAPPPLESAKVNVEARLARERGKASGYLRGEVNELTTGLIKRGKLALDLSAERGIASGSVAAELDRAGRGSLELQRVVLPEPPFDSRELAAITGGVHVSGNLDVRYLGAVFALEQVPIERGQGKVMVDLDVQRPEAGRELPSVVGRIETKNLELVGKRKSVPTPTSPEHARAAAPWLLSDVDLDAKLDLDGKSGKTDVALRAFDERGDLARLDAHTRLGPGLQGALHPELAKLPIEAKLSVPARSFDDWPSIVPIAGTAGSGGLELEVEGTALDPRLRFRGRVAGLRPVGSQAQPLDFDFHGVLERDGGELEAAAATKGRKVGTLNARWQGDLTKIPDAGPEHSPVRGQAELTLDRLPIGALPGSLDRQIQGELSGRVALLGFGEDARLDARIEARPLRIADGRFERVVAVVRAEKGKLDATADLVQKDGSARAALRAEVDWGARVSPRVKVPVESNLEAKNFRLAGLTPLAPGTINELDGRLNARFRGHFGGGEPELEGSADLEQGVLQEPMIGQRFHDISAHVRMVPGEVRLERFSARGTSGRLTATASARLRGLELLGLRAHVNVDKDEKLALTTQGVAIGDGWGKVDAAIDVGNEQRGTTIAITVPEFHLELPESERGGVQDLEPAEYVRVGVKPKNNDFATIPLQPLEKESEPQAGPPTVLTVELGKKVTVRRGMQLDVTLSGTTRIVMAEQTRISGQIRLQGGTLDVSGKLFHIERGIITFDGQNPDNPMVVATARWDSPADYVVYVEYTGTASEGQLNLTSEPPLTQDQILSLLMFGNPDGTMGSSSGSPAATAFGVAGGTAVRGLNRVLSKVTKFDLDARVDTSTGSARPELVLQLSPRLSAHLTRALGEPAPGQAPDRTFAMLDLKLGGRWSLDTTVGDRGASALDLIWRYRY